MRKIILLLKCLGLLTFAGAQPQFPAVLAPGGTTAKGETITLEWTLGELAVSSFATPSGMLTEGFHQPILRVVDIPERAPEIPGHHLGITVAPNPVSSILSIRIRSELEGRAVIDLWDLTGRRLQRSNARLSGDELKWDMSAYPASMYILSVRTEGGELLQNLKVTKIN